VLHALALAFVLVARAYAADAVRLPPGEDPAAWREPVAVTGLADAVAAEGAQVELVAGASSWTVRVRSRTGAVREATVAAPRSPEDREAVAALALSLLSPVDVAPAAPKPAPPPRPAAAAPPPKPRPVAPAPAPVTPPPAPEPVVVAPPPKPPPAPSLAAGVGVGLRGDSNAAPALWARGETPVAGPLRAHVEAFGTLPASLGESLEGYRLADVGLAAGLAAVGEGTLAGMASGSVGLVSRSLSGSAGAAQVVPVVGVATGLRVDAGPVAMEPALRLVADLRGTHLVVGDEVQRLPPWGLHAGLSVILPVSR
jgi:hypothetical protein